jgi:hypothetical protein
MKLVSSKSVGERIEKVRSLIKSTGNKIGSVHFIKRSDGTKRKMAYRMHVSKPTYASQPTGNKDTSSKDISNTQLTVFDVNKVRYNKKGKMNGRGDWRTIPLENVTRIAVNGEIHKII